MTERLILWLGVVLATARVLITLAAVTIQIWTPFALVLVVILAIPLGALLVRAQAHPGLAPAGGPADPGPGRGVGDGLEPTARPGVDASASHEVREVPRGTFNLFDLGDTSVGYTVFRARLALERVREGCGGHRVVRVPPPGLHDVRASARGSS